MTHLGIASAPCGSCPYRRDVPSGIWDVSEYRKLPAYDGPTWQQSPKTFMCHQRDGNVCAGWTACHGGRSLLALRIDVSRGTIDPVVLDYKTSVPVFATGAEALKHGIAHLRRPRGAARRLIAKLMRRRS